MHFIFVISVLPATKGNCESVVFLPSRLAHICGAFTFLLFFRRRAKMPKLDCIKYLLSCVMHILRSYNSIFPQIFSLGIDFIPFSSL